MEHDLAFRERASARDRKELADGLGREVREQRPLHGPSLRHSRDNRNAGSDTSACDRHPLQDEMMPVKVLFADHGRFNRARRAYRSGRGEGLGPSERRPLRQFEKARWRIRTARPE
jgi:hypothetical protein